MARPPSRRPTNRRAVLAAALAALSLAASCSSAPPPRVAPTSLVHARSVFVRIPGHVYIGVPTDIRTSIREVLEEDTDLRDAIVEFETRSAIMGKEPAATIVAIRVVRELARRDDAVGQLLEAVAGPVASEGHPVDLEGREGSVTGDELGITYIAYRSGPVLVCLIGGENRARTETVARALVAGEGEATVGTSVIEAEEPSSAFGRLEGYGYAPVPPDVRDLLLESTSGPELDQAVEDRGFRAIEKGGEPIGLVLVLSFRPGYAAFAGFRRFVIEGVGLELGRAPGSLLIDQQIAYTTHSLDGEDVVFWVRGTLYIFAYADTPSEAQGIAQALIRGETAEA